MVDVEGCGRLSVLLGKANSHASFRFFLPLVVRMTAL
jgi:hypothetical protein